MTELSIYISIAGLSALWKNLLDEPLILRTVKRLPYVVSRALTCGFCFTYWLSLIVLLIMDNFTFDSILSFIKNWMILSLISASLYYLFMILQEISIILAHKHEAMHKKSE